MQSYNLKEVNEYIKQVISLNFEESIWIDAEISQYKEVRGQVYLEFIHKPENSDQITAKAQGVIWYKTLLFIKKKLGELADSILMDGRKIRFKAKIDFHDIYGLKFTLEDIEPSYTLGVVEINRQKTISKLKKGNLLAKNKETNLPLVIKNIAIISSEKAAGLQDFYEHLSNNPYDYKFNTILFDSSMQGNNVERDVVSSLVKIKEKINSFDCVVIIRGGGSKMDLSYFDSYNISANVAKFPIPILTGIGHEIDQNVIEMVTHSPLKTPTAVADFIVENNLHFEMKINEIYQNINYLTINNIRQKVLEIENINNNIKNSSIMNISNSLHSIESIFIDIKNKSSNKLLEAKSNLNEISNFIRLSDPKQLFKKGYSVTTKNGKIVKSIKNINKNDVVKTVLIDGEFESEVL